MSKRLTKEKFVERSIEIHDDKYDYSLVEYKNCEKKIKIICNVHGVFEQTPIGHLSGRGCFKCNGNILWSNDKFIDESKKIHGDKYDYSKTEYVSQQKRVTIICKIHGEFEQWAQHHLKGVGCPKCSGKMTSDEFIEKAKIIHGDRYDYSKTSYSVMSKKIIIICREHGNFLQNPVNHLSGCQCPKCGGRNKEYEEIVKEFVGVHGNTYDYSKVNYTFSKKKLLIVCKEHGEFKQSYNNHLKSGCPKCAGRHKTNDVVIKEFKIIHGNKYDYSKVDYKRANDKIIIICPKHGEFKQSPNTHLHGYGCPKCNYSKGEMEVERVLKINNITYETQKYLDGCKNILPLKFDFYLPKHNMCIEYDGEQHFSKYRFEKNNDKFELRQMRDKIKTNFCIENDIKLIRISYKENIEEKIKWILNQIN